MSDQPTSEAIASLSEREREVLGFICIGEDGGHPRQTLRSLERKGLIAPFEQTLPGWPPVKVTRYDVPPHVHIAWCDWCAANPLPDEPPDDK